MRFGRYLVVISALCMLMIMESCRKDLCYNHFRTASVALDWESEWERDYGMNHPSTWNEPFHGFSYNSLRPGMPEGVTMLTYRGSGDPLTTFLDAVGGDVNIGEAGQHSSLFYNNDTEYIVLSDIATLPQARASTTTRTRSTLGTLRSMHPDERTINPPDVLYAAFIESMPEIGIHETAPVPVRMQPLVYTYVIRYEFEHGAEHVALARGALAGMAESVYLRTGATSEEAATILYDCETTSYGAVAIVRSFGVPGFTCSYYGRFTGSGGGVKTGVQQGMKTGVQEYMTRGSREGRKYTLNLEVKLKNGKTKEFLFDVTDQLARQPRGGVIIVGGIRVEDDENLNDSGFDVNVEDWGEEEDVDLTVGVN